MTRRFHPARQTTTTLIAEVANELGISTKEARPMVMAVFNVIARTASAGHDTAITNFGTFRSMPVAERISRNPQNGDKFITPAQHRIRFRPARRLAEIIRNRDTAADITKLVNGSLR
ncbi:HU family DNA-binding protein [Streptomyces sp. CAU 1734]|uniref:HU family DNA-binding protein n=1 Tax=Streptomyces sp. CAU 1734 TaxID=3140360 RepID=UPI003260C8DD